MLRASKLHLLTVREVQTASEGDHTDGGGLLLRIRGSSRSWVFRFTSPSGRRREMGLGAVRLSNSAETGDSLRLARKLANEARQQLQLGKDPINERDRARQAAREEEALAGVRRRQQSLTLARVGRDYHARAIEPRLTSKHSAQWIASLENHVPHAIWHKPISEIGAPDLLAALSGVRSLEGQETRVPETLRRIRQRLDAIFEDAVFHGHCQTNPAAAVKRKLREALPLGKSGAFKALDYRIAPAFVGRLRSAPGTAARCLEFALLTAARTSEALGARWSELDLDANTWQVPAWRMKGKEIHVVHLTKRARELVTAQHGADDHWLFPSAMKRDRPLSNMALLATLDRLGMREQTTVHGLCRATFSTWAYETGAARPDVIEACLAHREADRVKAAYNRAQFTQERRALLEAWSEYLSGG